MLKLRVALISRDGVFCEHARLRLEGRGYQVIPLTRLPTVLGTIYSDPPDIMLVDLAEDDDESRELLRVIKEDSYFSIIPVIGLVRGDVDADFEWDRHPLDDFLSHPVYYPELFNRIALSLQRIRRIFDNNPLTKLPGNTSIQQAIERSLGKPMAVCYIDINNFKPYNDTYGFARGDEVLRMVARIMVNTVKAAPGGFAGHIGGDDFVFIVQLERAEAVCKSIIANFGIIMPDLFGDEDKARGYYVAKDRKGEEQQIPLLGISIAVVPTNNEKIQHFGMIAEIAAELKKVAKKSTGSCYVVDRRAR